MIKLGSLLNEINFVNQDQFDVYVRQHDMRPDTKVTIAGKKMTVSQASSHAPVTGSSKKQPEKYSPDSKMAMGLQKKTGVNRRAAITWAEKNGVDLEKIASDIDSKKLNPMDFMTAVVGNTGNKYAKDIIAKYTTK